MPDRIENMSHEELEQHVESAFRYGRELDQICDMLEKFHPIGEVKGIGRMEAVRALSEVLAKHPNWK